MDDAKLGFIVRKTLSHLGLGFAIFGWVFLAYKLDGANWYWELSPFFRWLIPFPLAALYILFCILVYFFASGQWRRNPDKKVTKDEPKE